MRSFDQGPGVQSGYGGGGQVLGRFGPTDFNQSVQAAQNAAYGQATSRLDPQWQQAEQQQIAQLTAQGLGPNSQAYQTAMANFGRAKTDAYNQANFGAIQAGQDIQQQLFGQAAQQAGFANAAQAQQYGQNQQAAEFANQAAAQAYAQGQGAAGFYNQAAQADFQNRLAQGQFYNTAMGQHFGESLQAAQFQNAAQQQALQQQAYMQNQPINQEWDERLTRVSDKFRQIDEKIRGYRPVPVPVPAV